MGVGAGEPPILSHLIMCHPKFGGIFHRRNEIKSSRAVDNVAAEEPRVDRDPLELDLEEVVVEQRSHDSTRT